MSIATQLEALQQDITNARTAITNKGGTVTSGGGSSQLASDIATIPSGGGGNLKDISPITKNGTYNAGNNLTPLNSITLTGAAYVATNIDVPDGCNWDVEAKFKVTQTLSGTDRSALFGAKGTSYYVLFNQTSSAFFLYMHGEYGTTVTPQTGTEYTIIKNGNVATINGTNMNKASDTAVVSANALDLFGYNEDSTHSRLFIGEFEYLKFIENGTITHWFIPVKDTNNVIKIYDKVTCLVYDFTGSGVTAGTASGETLYAGFASPLTVAIDSSKYGATVNGILGDVNASGVLQKPTEQTTLNFTGVKQIPDKMFRYKFEDQPNLVGVSFPDLEIVDSYGLQYAFYAASTSNAGLLSLSMPNLTSVGTSGLSYAFYRQKLTNADIDLPNLTSISTAGFAYAFNNSNIKSFSTNLPTLTASNAFNYCFHNCTNTDFEVHFNNLTTVNASSGFNYAFGGNCLFKSKVAHPFPNLTTINGSSAFASSFTYSTATRIVFDKLEHIGNSSGYSIFGNAFQYSSMGSGTDYDKFGLFMPTVKTIGYNSTSSRQMFTGCFASSNNRHTMHFYDLTKIYNSSSTTNYGQFAQCQAKRVYMPKVTDMGTYNQTCFNASTSTEEIHFGIENEATIKAMTGYATKFGATNATIYFDMVNHIMVDGINYYRDGANCDLDNWYFAWQNPSVPSDIIYTTNFKDPAVGDTTYTKSGDTYIAGSTITAVS